MQTCKRFEDISIQPGLLHFAHSVSLADMTLPRKTFYVPDKNTPCMMRYRDNSTSVRQLIEFDNNLN